VALCCLPTLFWRLTDSSYPVSDAGDYFQVTQSIYNSFHINGFISGMKDLYLLRAWKPIILPSLGVPFLFITGGKVVPAVTIYVVTIVAFFSLYLFRMLRLWLPILPAALASLVIVTTPTVFMASIDFMTELSFSLFVLMTVFYILVADYNRMGDSIKIALAASFAFFIRPAEGALYLAPFAVSMLFKLLRTKSISNKFILIQLLLIAALGFLLIHHFFVHHIHLNGFAGVIYLFLPFLSTWLCFREGTIPRNLSILFSTFYLLVILYFWLDYLNLFYWIQGTTLGELAQETGKRKGMSFLNILFGIASWHGKYLNLILFASTVSAVFISRFRQSRFSLSFMMSALFAFLLPIILGLFTFNGDRRYYTTGFIFIYILMMVTSLRIPKKHLSWFMGIALIALVLNSTFIIQRTLNHRIFPATFGHFVPLAIPVGKDHAFLTEVESWDKFNQPDTIILTYPILESINFLDPWRFPIVAKEKYPNLLTQIYTPNITIPESDVWPLIKIHEMCAKKHLLIVIGPIGDDLVMIDNPFNHGNAMASTLLAAYRQMNFSQIGFSLRREFSINQPLPHEPGLNLKYLMLECSNQLNN